MSAAIKDEKTLVFSVSKILWQNEDGEKEGKKPTKWKIVVGSTLVDGDFPGKVRGDKENGERTLVKITGEMDAPTYREQKLDAYGNWEFRNNEWSFKAAYIATHFPTCSEHSDVILFLQHCGLRIARKVIDVIVGRYAYDLRAIAEGTDEIAATVKGISYSTCVRLAEKINQAEAISALMHELKDIGIDYSCVVKIVRKHGDEALRIIHENPFALLKDVGFTICDRIHLGFGGSVLAPERLAAALEAGCLIYERRNLSVLAQRDKMLDYSLEALNRKGVAPVTRQQLDERLDQLLARYTFVKQGDYIYSKDDFITERDLSHKLYSLANAPVGRTNAIDVYLRTLDAWNENGILLEGQQKKAVAAVAQNVVTALTGGPGTGKTTTIRAIIDCYKTAFPDAPIVLMAPTGLAAKRMSDCAGREAFTCHKALGLMPSDTASGFSVEGETQDMSGLVIVDETSMVGIHLAGFLMDSIVYTPKTRVVFVGDIFQLPPVSQGAFFEDLISSDVVPVTYLERNFRQEAGSTIIDAAYAIKNGASNAIRYTDDFSLVRCRDAEIMDRIVGCFKEGVEKYGLPQTFVLSPMHRAGELCTDKINPILQDIVNPRCENKTWVRRGTIEFREGDRVICTKNAENVVNGDIGTIEAIGSNEDGELEVRVLFETATVGFTRDKLEMLDLAYAISVHKSQGCEFSCVIIPATFSQNVMLVRNLLYTGVTRAKKKVYLVGTEAAVGKAARTVPPTVTKSLLPLRLRKQKRDSEQQMQIALAG